VVERYVRISDTQSARIQVRDGDRTELQTVLDSVTVPGS
jgi:hypothetical protein